MDTIAAYTEIIKENIEYDCLMIDCGIYDGRNIDEMVDIMAEVVSIPRESLRIAGIDYPYQLVKSKLLKLDSGHIRYVLECLHNNTTKVRNVKSYLLTSLYNAPSTINNYYRAEVNHDMYGTD